jgi:hypothetical protein
MYVHIYNVFTYKKVPSISLRREQCISPSVDDFLNRHASRIRRWQYREPFFNPLLTGARGIESIFQTQDARWTCYHLARSLLQTPTSLLPSKNSRGYRGANLPVCKWVEDMTVWPGGIPESALERTRCNGGKFFVIFSLWTMSDVVIPILPITANTTFV